MHDARRLELGSPVVCSDGQIGELLDIVIEPSTRHVTYVVVEPHHRHWLARLITIDMVSAASDENGLSLACTVAQAGDFEQMQRTVFLPIGGELPIDEPDWDVGIEGVLMQPAHGPEARTHDAVMAATYDRIPKGEVEIRRASTVISVDDHPLGHVDACVIDDETRITHLVLERGHLWARHDVTIPIHDVATMRSDAITLHLSEAQVEALQPIPAPRAR